MGGDAGAESTPGVGSTFWFTARLHRAAPIAAPPPPSAGGAAERLSRDHAGRRVLLAEDDPVNQEIALMFLSDVGLQVDVVGNGAEAVRRSGEENYALILLDVQMPVMNGLEAARQIRQSPRGGTVPVIAMTANAFAEDKAQCLAAGMDDFVAKPIDPPTLYATLLKWLARRP